MKKNRQAFPALFLGILLLVVSGVLYLEKRNGCERGEAYYRELRQEEVLTEELRTGEKDALEILWERMKEKNPDYMGWLRIPGTCLDYPVVQGKDNAFYLTHGMDGGESPAGALFLDYENEKGFLSENAVLYGHNMKNGTMLAELKKYRREDYYREHPILYVFTAEEILEYRIFSVAVTDPESEVYTLSFPSREAFREYLEERRRDSLYPCEAEEEGEHILTLSTCINGNRQRLVVQGIG